tara:strand:- start:7689 stop:8195 length:507 start_codon:yes stop_codon:yes gene_type:complete
MRTFKEDIKRIDGGVFRKMLNISFWIIFNFRISCFFYKNGFFIISKFFWLVNRIVFTVDIDPGADLAGGLKLIHPMCIVVGREVTSLGNLTLYQSTTLGGSNDQEIMYKGKIVRQPYIYKDVIIYTSSVVIGPLIIGANSTIATNSTITKNVPENSIAFGVNSIKLKS